MPDRPTVYLLTYSDKAVAEPIERGFEQQGWNYRQFVFSMPRISPTIVGLRKLADPMVERKLLAAEYNRIIRNELVPALRDNPPDLLLVMKGHRIDRDNYEAIRASGVPIFLWFYDSQERFSHQGDLVPIARKIYVIDQHDVEDSRYVWLPLGYDEQIFLPSDANPSIDILFIGKLEPRYYSTRRRYLLDLANSDLTQRYRVASIGTTGSRLRDKMLGIKPPFQWLAPRMQPHLYAARIASAKIVVNIHQNDGGKPVNPMFFGVAGCRVCQVLDQRDYLSEWMTPNEHFVPVNPKSYLSTLEDLLQDEKRQKHVAMGGYRASLSHTFLERIKRLVSDFNELS
jgi:Glycosyl transferases group 1